jgi:hypothetical protein
LRLSRLLAFELPALKGSGNKNVIGDRRTIVLDDNAVVVTGFYELTRMQDGKPVPRTIALYYANR